MKSKIIERDNGEKELARPLKVLVPLIKSDLRERERLRNEASETIEIEIGRKLIEAKGQMARGKWIGWLGKNFHLSDSRARLFMRYARDQIGSIEPISVEQYRRRNEPSYEDSIKRGGGDWAREVKAEAKAAAEEQEQREREDREEKIEAAESKAEISLAIRLIDIGYRVLATELHPDKKGGSDEAMRRLNEVRKKLKQAAANFDWAGQFLARYARR